MNTLRYRRRGSGLILPIAIFAGVFTGATWALAPDAPGKAIMAAEASKRSTDYHYQGCNAARANGHQNITSMEPSYRERMDGDGDGVACESHLGW